MKKIKKLVACICALTLFVGGVSVTDIVNSKANESLKVCSERDTHISIDKNGELILSRNELGDKSMGKEDSWTLLIYLCGSDLESTMGFATEDIGEIIAAGENENVNIVIQTGGSSRWNKYDISSENIQRYIVKNDKLELLDTLPNANMGESSTIEDFIKWGVDTYPAEHMGAIFWNHGGGIEGACRDENFNSMATLNEFEKAMHNATKDMTDKFEIVGFDACLMACVEAANLFVPYAEYYVASEESEAGDGWEYTSLVNKLVENPDIDGLELGKTIVDGFMARGEETGAGSGSTLSVIDLSKIDDVIVSFNKVAKKMWDMSDSKENITKFTKLAKAAKEYTPGYGIDLIDMGDYMYILSDVIEEASDVASKIEEAVVYEKHGSEMEDSTGLTFFYSTYTPQMGTLDKLRNTTISPYIMKYFEKTSYYGTMNTIDGFEGNNWENSDYYFDKNFDFVQKKYFSVGEFKSIWANDEYYKKATFDDKWLNWLKDMENDGCVEIDEELDKVLESALEGSNIEELSDVKELKDAVEVQYKLFKEDGKGNLVLGDVYCKDTLSFNNQWFALEDGQYIEANLINEGNGLCLYDTVALIDGKESYIKFAVDKYNSVMVLGYAEIKDEIGSVGRFISDIPVGTKIIPIYNKIDVNTGNVSNSYGSECVINDKIIQSKDISDVSFGLKKVDAFGKVSYSNSKN